MVWSPRGIPKNLLAQTSSLALVENQKIVKENNKPALHFNRHIQELATADPTWLEERHPYQELLDLAPDGLLVTDGAAEILIANLAAASMLHSPRPDLQGKPLIAFVAQQDRALLLDHLTSLQFGRAEQVHGLQIKLEPASGVPYPSSITIAAVHANTGDLLGFYWLLKDDSDTARAEQALRHSEERFRLITENAADLIAIVDAQGKRLYNSPSYETILGYSTDELKEGWAFAEIHPEDRARVMDAAQETFRTGTGQVLQYRMRHKNGSWRTLQSSGGAIRNSRGEIESLVIVAHDITERKQVEDALVRRADEFAALYQTTRDLADFHDLPAVLQTIVERSMELLAASSSAIYLYDATSQDLELVVQKGFPQPLGTRRQLGEGIAGHVAQSREPLIVNDYSHSSYPALQYADTPITAAVQVPMLYRGDLIGVLAIAEIGTSPPSHAAVTREFNEADARLLSLFAAQAASAVQNARLFEQVRAGRERLKILSSRLMEAQEVERRSIARELHDEIGQALTAVHLNLQAALSAHDPAAVAPRLEDSLLMIEQLLQQVRNLSLDLRPSLLDNVGLVAALRWYINRQANRTGLSVEFIAERIEQKFPPELETACFRFMQEALTNIVRHARAQHVRVELKENGSELQLVITDDGIGFDVDTALQQATRGASLGLLGMRERVLLVGGRVRIESTTKHGTQVSASFPLASPQNHLERRARRISRRESDTRAAGG